MIVKRVWLNDLGEVVQEPSEQELGQFYEKALKSLASLACAQVLRETESKGRNCQDGKKMPVIMDKQVRPIIK